jgi:hypothetical protein
MMTEVVLDTITASTRPVASGWRATLSGGIASPARPCINLVRRSLRMAALALALSTGAAWTAAPEKNLPQLVMIELDQFGCVPEVVKVKPGEVILQVRGRDGVELSDLRLSRGQAVLHSAARPGLRVEGLSHKIMVAKGEYILQLGASSKHRCVVTVE